MVNPIPLVKKPSTPQGRSCILSDDELNRLFDALKPRVKNANTWASPANDVCARKRYETRGNT